MCARVCAVRACLHAPATRPTPLLQAANNACLNTDAPCGKAYPTAGPVMFYTQGTGATVVLQKNLCVEPPTVVPNAHAFPVWLLHWLAGVVAALLCRVSCLP
jgi:hypothetical protein